MAIDVRYPDGSWRSVPSELRAADAATNGIDARFSHHPINSDPQWRFLFRNDIWHAVPRKGAVALLMPALDHWWQGINAMTDAPVPADRDARPPRAA